MASDRSLMPNLPLPRREAANTKAWYNFTKLWVEAGRCPMVFHFNRKMLRLERAIRSQI